MYIFVRDYLTANAVYLDGVEIQNRFYFPENAGHILILRACLTCLHFEHDDLLNAPFDSELHARTLSYAKSNWPLHAKMVEAEHPVQYSTPCSIDACSEIEGYLREEEAKAWSYLNKNLISPANIHSLALCCASHFGLLHVLENIFNTDILIHPEKPHLLSCAFMEASLSGREDMTKQLIELGAEVKTEDSMGATVLHYAVLGGNTDLVTLFLAEQPDINQADRHGVTPIQLAARFGQLQILKQFLESHADVAKVDKDGFGPLHWATTRADLEMVKVLLENHPEIANTTDTDGVTALLLAAKSGDMELFQCMSKVSDPAHTDSYGQKLLHYAVQGENLDLVEIVLNLKEIDVLNEDNKRRIILHTAAVVGNKAIFERLQALQLDPDKVDENGLSVLFYAVIGGNSELVKIISELTPEPEMTDNYGRTALHLAAEFGSLTVVQ